MFEKSGLYPPCALAHHQSGYRVVWTDGLVRRRGIVMEHNAVQRFITVRLPGGATKAMPCGGVAAAAVGW